MDSSDAMTHAERIISKTHFLCYTLPGGINLADLHSRFYCLQGSNKHLFARFHECALFCRRPSHRYACGLVGEIAVITPTNVRKHHIAIFEFSVTGVHMFKT